MFFIYFVIVIILDGKIRERYVICNTITELQKKKLEVF